MNLEYMCIEMLQGLPQRLMLKATNVSNKNTSQTAQPCRLLTKTGVRIDLVLEAIWIRDIRYIFFLMSFLLKSPTYYSFTPRVGGWKIQNECAQCISNVRETGMCFVDQWVFHCSLKVDAFKEVSKSREICQIVKISMYQSSIFGGVMIFGQCTKGTNLKLTTHRPSDPPCSAP